jgi:hypothetical protein
MRRWGGEERGRGEKEDRGGRREGKRGGLIRKRNVGGGDKIRGGRRRGRREYKQKKRRV